MPRCGYIDMMDTRHPGAVLTEETCNSKDRRCQDGNGVPSRMGEKKKGGKERQGRRREEKKEEKEVGQKNESCNTGWMVDSLRQLVGPGSLLCFPESTPPT